MAFKIKSVTARNFLSIGNITQAVDFSKEQLTLVLGENIDLGGGDGGQRNGVGKTAILNALSYALFGQALTNIKKDNLINHTNCKNMLVTTDFEKNNISYRIERGRKPNVLKLFINNQELKSDSVEEDDSQGDSRETQKYIEQMLEMSHTMFKHLVALNTYTEPFLSLKSSEQRELIEQLLGITLLSEKAEKLKNNIKEVKEQIQQETFKIESIKTANESVQKSIDSLQIKSNAWDNKRDTDIEKLGRAILNLEGIDIPQELAGHQAIKLWEENNTRLKNLNKQRATLETAVSQADKTIAKYIKELELLEDKKCPACEQDLHDHKHEEMTAVAQQHLDEAVKYFDKVTKDLKKTTTEITALGEVSNRPNTYYDTVEEALKHQNNLKTLETNLTIKVGENDPYQEQIEELMETALQEISWDHVNELTALKDHQEFLLKLLTSKDSFIRKKIIDQNLAYLNNRLTYYLDKMGLPHQVSFLNDLNVEITQLGQDLDFDNLSRGERNRLILGLSWAFRDVWESLYQNINLLFVDELIDNGLDASGVESALAVLKKMARERNKNIFLISHKDELIGRVNNVLKVIKENGFTSYANDLEVTE